MKPIRLTTIGKVIWFFLVVIVAVVLFFIISLFKKDDPKKDDNNIIITNPEFQSQIKEEIKEKETIEINESNTIIDNKVSEVEKIEIKND